MNLKSTREYYNQEANNYKKMYESDYEFYPANLIRLKLLIKLLKKNNFRTILDVGCGTAVPMIKLLKNGFNVNGLDYSENMVYFGQKELEQANYSPDLIYHANIEKKNSLKNKKFDAILALGVFPHIQNEKIALRNIKNLLNKKGKAYIEFRNLLFSTFSLNKYSIDFFLNDLIDINSLPKYIQKNLINFYSKKLSVKKPEIRKDGRISYNDILAKFHNPLTIEKELFEPLKMKIDNIHFYHFHAIPPIFEKQYPKIFRKTSLTLEKPDNWKGYFMSSAFVIEASKL